jgi:phage shock protein A
MTDIVERLRYQSKDFGYLRLEAAAEIEQLRAENAGIQQVATRFEGEAERLRTEIEQLRTEIARMQTGT